MFIGLLIAVMYWFYNRAIDNGLNRFIWTILPIPAYYGFQLVIVFLIDLIYPSVFNSTSKIIMISALSGIIGLLFLYLAMTVLINNRKKDSNLNENILDSEL